MRRCAVAYLDLNVDGPFLIVQLIIVIRIHLQVVESELFLNSLLESQTLLESKRIGLGDYGNNVDDIGKFLQDHDIDWLETEEIRQRLALGDTGGCEKESLTHDQMVG